MTEICAECGEMTWEPRWDDDPFCEECWEEIFGYDESEIESEEDKQIRLDQRGEIK